MNMPVIAKLDIKKIIMSSEKIWLSSPHMGEQELEYVQEAFATNWIAPLGPHVNAFETSLSAFTGRAHAAALSSGTAALHLALIQCGVEQGDVVIAQSFTFSGTVNPVAYQKAELCLIDSESDTWNMDPVLMREACEHYLNKGVKPKAIIPVHLYGMPAKMEEIMAVAAAFDIPVIEDAAEALGSQYKGKPCGSFGVFSALSFNGNKIITTSGGGALLGDEEHAIARTRFLATQARDAAPHYQHSEIGYNYRMSNVCAAIGRGQMEVLDQRVEKRRANYSFYEAQLGDLPGISFLKEPEGHFSNRWLTCLLIDPAPSGGVSRETIRLALETHNIESRPLWKPMHLQPAFSSATMFGGKVSEQLFEKGLCLPSGSNLTGEQLQSIVAIIGNCFQ